MEEGRGEGESGKTDGEKLAPNPPCPTATILSATAILVKPSSDTLKLSAETCVQRRCKTERDQFHEVVLRVKLLFFSPLRPLRAVAE